MGLPKYFVRITSSERIQSHIALDGGDRTTVVYVMVGSVGAVRCCHEAGPVRSGSFRILTSVEYIHQI